MFLNQYYKKEQRPQARPSPSRHLRLLQFFLPLLFIATASSISPCLQPNLSPSASLCVQGSSQSTFAIKDCHLLLSFDHLEQPSWHPSLLSSLSSPSPSPHLLPWFPSIKAVQHPLLRSKPLPTLNGRLLRLPQQAQSTISSLLTLTTFVSSLASR